MFPIIDLITVEISPGTKIEEAAQDIVKIANFINLAVNFNFNGANFRIHPNSNVNDIVTSFYNYMKRVNELIEIGSNKNAQ